MIYTDTIILYFDYMFIENYKKVNYPRYKIYLYKIFRAALKQRRNNNESCDIKKIRLYKFHTI